jgi:hypothetical protein
MPDGGIDAPGDQAAAPEFRPVDGDRTGEEQPHTGDDQQPCQHRQSIEHRVAGLRDMRQKELREPGSRRPVMQDIERWPVGRVEVQSERTDHEQDLEDDD